MRALLLLIALAIGLLADPAGTYKGTYTGGAGGGDFILTVADSKAEVSFTVGGEMVKAKTTSYKVDGAKIRIVYTFDLQGTTLESTVTGELAGNTITGAYQTKTSDGSGVDEGTWKATQ